MRLIDADKLIRTVRFLTLRDGKEIEIHYVEVERIDSAPTIDAVPVSFIFDKMSTINSEYINIRRLIAAEPETVERRLGIETNLLCEYNALRNLIREWEGNENGKTD